ncbi:hypothetical protein [Streptomyces hydrogenans]|uniref:hypothetical protein n=1 Tax=Streptomyces hydrogenans TaxID=1873719 RepID=UPI0035E297CB
MSIDDGINEALADLDEKVFRDALWRGVLEAVNGVKAGRPGHFSSRGVGRYSDDGQAVACTMTMGQDDGTQTVYDITVSVAAHEDSRDGYWLNHASTFDDRRRVVVDGQHYVIGSGSGGGFGGRRFDIEFFDGRKVTTYDLWSQGTIPPKHRERYPDNARFIPRASLTFDLGEAA